jgi:hypothetical protein
MRLATGLAISPAPPLPVLQWDIPSNKGVKLKAV